MPVSARREKQASSQPCIFQMGLFFFFFKGARAKQREALVAICFTLRNETITCLHRCTVNHFDELAEREVLLLPHFLPWKSRTLFQNVGCGYTRQAPASMIYLLCAACLFIHNSAATLF